MPGWIGPAELILRHNARSVTDWGSSSTRGDNRSLGTLRESSASVEVERRRSGHVVRDGLDRTVISRG
jgi:hypothetical protein